MLTKQQEAFAKLVAKGSSYAGAFREAYPKSKEWKDESVWVESSKLMSNTKVAQRVKELQKPADDETKFTIKEILTKIKYWVEFDPAVFYEEDGTFKQLKDIPVKDRQCLNDLKIKETWAGGGKTGRIIEIKLPDKKGLIDMVNKMLGAYINVNVEAGKSILSEEARSIIDEITE